MKSKVYPKYCIYHYQPFVMIVIKFNIIHFFYTPIFNFDGIISISLLSESTFCNSLKKNEFV